MSRHLGRPTSIRDSITDIIVRIPRRKGSHNCLCLDSRNEQRARTATAIVRTVIADRWCLMAVSVSKPVGIQMYLWKVAIRKARLQVSVPSAMMQETSSVILPERVSLARTARTSIGMGVSIIFSIRCSAMR